MTAKEVFKTAPTYEIKRIEPLVVSVLGPELACEDLGADRSCVPLGENLYPGEGSKFIVVTIVLRNAGSEASEVTSAVIHALRDDVGTTYQPTRVSTKPATIQPAGTGTLHAAFEIPDDVLDSSVLGISIDSSDPIEFDFESPKEYMQRVEARRADLQEKDDQAAAEEELAEERRTKCWSLQEPGGATISRDEFGWYVENCSHLFSVGSYESYLRGRR